MINRILQILGCIGLGLGIIVTLAIASVTVAAIAVIAVIGALLYMALSPVLEDIGAWYRRRKIIKVTARYARRFLVLLVLVAYRGRP